MKKQKLFAADGRQIEISNPASDNDDRQAAAEQAEMLGQLLGRQVLYRRPGIHLGKWFFSTETVLLTALLVCAIIIIKKM